MLVELEEDDEKYEDETLYTNARKPPSTGGTRSAKAI
ncbi:hypothetical protein PR003_g15792 [Phytophthora rubi]|uniref:Uncharacterized protein n=1 Tax=Phytophthora rubi TaxID=129364 RepID=A0A6A4EW37_9STRA|nr:hypothetical protein PR003_g15792 [Phytophthora rubi]